jgi:uroporphyrinogen decarboxylase
MELTVTEPDLIAAVLDKCVAFLIEYIRAFQSAGADGVLMAEPAAGLLSPRSMALHSSKPIRTIAEIVSDNRFAVILHNCAAKPLHLPAMLETGLKAFHFGTPMNMSAALNTIPSDVIVAGNLDPSAVFCQSSPDDVRARTTELLAVTQSHPNYVLSSGCDLPAQTPLANLDAFFAAAG